MNLRDLKYIIAVAEPRHFGKAAARCFVSQPTLSGQVKKLEEELGVPIILRDQKFQGFTTEGQRVVEWAKRLLSDRSAMLEELAIICRSPRGPGSHRGPRRRRRMRRL